jgi:hypothetical protein
MKMGFAPFIIHNSSFIIARRSQETCHINLIHLAFEGEAGVTDNL